MQIRAVWAVLLLAAAPTHSAERPAPSVVFATLVLAKAGGQSATLVNQAFTPLGIGQCEPLLERLEPRGWVAPEEQELTGCDVEPRYLMPGDSGTVRFSCPDDAGTYRLSIPLILERETLEPLTSVAYSLPFQSAPNDTDCSVHVR